MSNVKVPTKSYVDNFGHNISIVCNETTDTIVIDFYKKGKYSSLLIWTLNNDVCLYGITVANNENKEDSRVYLYTIYKGPEASDKTVNAYIVSVDDERMTIGLTSNVRFWDVATIFAPCKVRGHAHN